jgi:oligopeptide/dipeptide ABC transporter ATP-binding protein
LTLLAIEDLTVTFPVGGRPVEVVSEVTFGVDRGEMVGLVGESGSGKTMTALAVMRLVPPPGRIAAGRIAIEGDALLAMSEPEMRRVRGARIAMVFQEPMTALNPVFTIGDQIVEALRAHRDTSRAGARREAERLLDLVAMPDPPRRLDDYPHRLSGGQRQRAMIAMALACSPQVLLADEPTTALDVTIQAQILELLERLRRELELAVVLITHDLSVVAETCDRVVVMYAGRVVEEAPATTLFASPSHPYTRGLLAALPRLGRPAPRGELPSIPGQIPDAAARPSGCAFHPRCPEVFERCRHDAPPELPVLRAQRARCFLHLPPSPP